MKRLLSKLHYLICVCLIYFSGLFCLLANAEVGSVKLNTYPASEFEELKPETSGLMFWQKPEIQAQMESRKIVVSVRHQQAYWSLKGAGHLNVPLDFAKIKILDFSKLADISDRFEDVYFDAASSKLKFKVRFLTKTYAMEFQLFEEVGKDFYKIYFKSSPSSAIAGILGCLQLLDAQRYLEVSHIAIAPKLPGWGPDWFQGFLVEGIMHHVAEQLRISIEHSYILVPKRKEDL